MLKKHPKLFQDPQIQYPDLTHLAFQDYIEACKTIISTHRVDAEPHMIEANTPFELHPLQTPARYGALLIHGLLDTPFVMRDIGTFLQQEGLLVRSLLLQGHGTVPGAMLGVHYKDWLQSVRYGIDSLAKEVEKVFLVGYSTGASLALYETLMNDANIGGIISLAPAFKIKSNLARVTKSPAMLINTWERAGWMTLAHEKDYAKYTSVPYHIVYEVYQLTEELKALRKEKKTSCPQFTILTHDDKIISSAAALKYFLQESNPQNRLIYYTTQPLALNDSRIFIRNSAYPELNILNFSHICLPVAPDNPHYGKQGSYHLASHPGENKDFYYSALDRAQVKFYATMYKMKLMQQYISRLTFNPDFDFMTQKIKEFIFS